METTMGLRHDLIHPVLAAGVKLGYVAQSIGYDDWHAVVSLVGDPTWPAHEIAVAENLGMFATRDEAERAVVAGAVDGLRYADAVGIDDIDAATRSVLVARSQAEA